MSATEEKEDRLEVGFGNEDGDDDETAEVLGDHTPDFAFPDFSEPSTEEDGEGDASLGPSSSPSEIKKKRKKWTLGEHIELKEGEPKRYYCKLCNCSFKWKQVFYHSFCPDGKKPLKCNLCDESFITKSHLSYHLRTHTGENPFKCTYCGKGFRDHGKLKRHEKIHTGECKLNCHICNKYLSSSTALKVHMYTHSVDKPFVCSVCGKQYSYKGNLQKHSLRHSKGYMCEHCGKMFVRKFSLITHTKMHSGLRPYSCQECKKTFKSKLVLDRHQLSHAEGLDFECTMCSVTFRRKDNLDRHIKNLHPEVMPSEVKKKSTSFKYLKKQSDNNTQKLEGRGSKLPHSNTSADALESSSVIKHTKLVKPNVEVQRESVIKFFSKS